MIIFLITMLAIILTLVLGVFAVTAKPKPIGNVEFKEFLAGYTSGFT